MSASRAQSPRYSIRNQLSIRLAVAASGSSFSRERSAQKGAARLRQSASCVTRQMTWPVVTGWPGSTESSETVPARGDVISFSIFIASTTQTT